MPLVKCVSPVTTCPWQHGKGAGCSKCCGGSLPPAVSTCALGRKRELPDFPDGEIPTTEYPWIRSLEGDNCVLSFLTGTNEQEGGVNVFFASGFPVIPEMVSSNLTESKNGAADHRSSNKAGVHCKQTQAPHSGVAVEAFCSFLFCLLKVYYLSIDVALWLVSGLLQHFILTCKKSILVLKHPVFLTLHFSAKHFVVSAPIVTSTLLPPSTHYPVCLILLLTPLTRALGESWDLSASAKSRKIPGKLRWVEHFTTMLGPFLTYSSYRPSAVWSYSRIIPIAPSYSSQLYQSLSKHLWKD